MIKRRLKSNKILIALPFWQGDKVAAMRLARLMADIEPAHSEWADFLFVARFDEKHDPATVLHVSRRFNTFTHISGRREVGWPAGCNGLMFGTMEWFYHKMLAEKIPWYKAILICEADTVPLTRNWIETASREWDRINRAKTTRIAGAMVGGAQFGRQHINGGCAMLSGEMKFLNWMVKAGASYGAIAGWDWVLADQFKAWGWADIPGMKSYWNRPTMGMSEVESVTKSGVFLLHGVKDDSLVKHARDLILR